MPWVGSRVLGLLNFSEQALYDDDHSYLEEIFVRDKRM